MSSEKKQGPTTTQHYKDLTGDPLPTVSINGWARVGTGKFHHYGANVSSCNYQRAQGVLVVADGTPDKANCCSSCLNNLRKAADLAKLRQTPRGRKQLEQAAGELADRMSQVFPTDANAGRQLDGPAGQDQHLADEQPARGIISGAWLNESSTIDPKQLDQLYGPPTVQRQPLLLTPPAYIPPKDGGWDRYCGYAPSGVDWVRYSQHLQQLSDDAQAGLVQHDARRALFDGDPLSRARALGITLDQDELASIANAAQHLARTYGINLDVAYQWVGVTLQDDWQPLNGALT